MMSAQLGDLSANKLEDFEVPPMSWLQVPLAVGPPTLKKRRKIQIPVDFTNPPKHGPLTHVFGKHVSCQSSYYSAFHVISQDNPQSIDGSATGSKVASELSFSTA